MYGHGCVPVKLFLWLLSFEFRKIFTMLLNISLFYFFQLFKNMKTFLAGVGGGEAIQNQEGTRFNPAGVCRLLPTIPFKSIQFSNYRVDHLSSSPAPLPTPPPPTPIFWQLWASFHSLTFCNSGTSQVFLLPTPHPTPLTHLCASWAG